MLRIKGNIFMLRVIILGIISIKVKGLGPVPPSKGLSSLF